MNSAIEEILKIGIVYVNGRDNRFRPIIVINATMIHLK